MRVTIDVMIEIAELIVDVIVYSVESGLLSNETSVGIDPVVAEINVTEEQSIKDSKK